MCSIKNGILWIFCTIPKFLSIRQEKKLSRYVYIFWTSPCKQVTICIAAKTRGVLLFWIVLRVSFKRRFRLARLFLSWEFYCTQCQWRNLQLLCELSRQWKSNKYCRYESEKIAWTVCQKLLQCWKAFQASCEPFSLSLSLSLLFTTYYQTVHTYLFLHLSNNLSIFPCNPLLPPCVVTNAHGPLPQPTAC